MVDKTEIVKEALEKLPGHVYRSAQSEPPKIGHPEIPKAAFAYLAKTFDSFGEKKEAEAARNKFINAYQENPKAALQLATHAPEQFGQSKHKSLILDKFDSNVPENWRIKAGAQFAGAHIANLEKEAEAAKGKDKKSVEKELSHFKEVRNDFVTGAKEAQRERAGRPVTQEKEAAEIER